MAYKFPDGASFQFSTTFAAAKTISAFTNADPGVATSTAHGFVDDEELLLISSGWEDATDSVFRADQLSVDTLSLKGLDTTSTTFFPAGGGNGATLQKVSAWKVIPQVLTIATSGGDARRATISPLARRTPINVPLGLNPVDITLTIGHDASNTVYQEMLTITRALTKIAFKMVLADGSATYGYGNMVVGSMPNMQSGRENQATVSINLLGRDVAYA
jgi:hypothetical protein